MSSLAVLHDAEQLVAAIERAGRPVPWHMRDRYIDAVAKVGAVRAAVRRDSMHGLGVLPALPALGWLLQATGVLAMVAAAIGVARGGFEVGEGVRELARGVREAAAGVGRALPWAVPIAVAFAAYSLARSR